MAGRITRFAFAAALVCALGVVAGAGRAADPKTTFQFALAPQPFVNAGANVLGSAKLTNDDRSTLTQISWVFYLPPGTSTVTGTPSACSTPTAGTNPFTQQAAAVTTCAVAGSLKPGQTIREFIVFPAPASGSSFSAWGSAQFKEGPNDNTPSHSDTNNAPASTGIAPANAQDAAGGCLSATSIATTAASGTSNPQSTGAQFSLDGTLPCTPIAISERPKNEFSGTEAFTTQISAAMLPAGVSTVTLSFTEAVLPNGATPAKFVLKELLNGTWTPVGACALDSNGNPVAPPGPVGVNDSCIFSRAKYGSKGIQLKLLALGTGIDDPFWGG